MKVSIIIPVYNGEAFVEEAVDSALAQPETGQVILVDDGSRDASLEICRKLARRHGQVDLLRHPDGGNHGAAASRNLGIAASEHEYVAFLDADDYFLPGRFKRAREIMTADPTIDGVYDAIGTVYEDEEVGQWYRQERKAELMTISKAVDSADLFDTLMDGEFGFFCTDGIVVRSRLFDKVGMFDTSLRMCEDTALWLKMSLMGRLAAGSLDEPVGMRRLHRNNTIFQHREQNPMYERMMFKSLLSWGRQTGLSASRRLQFLELILNIDIGEMPCNVSYAWRKVREVRLFALFALRYPQVMRSQHYWEVIGATVGWKRFRGLFGIGANALPRT